MTLSYTPLRHKMLAAIAAWTDAPALYCANMKRSIWRPCFFEDDGSEVHYPAGTSRAIADIWGADLADTPGWNGDLNRYRLLKITESGSALLSSWDAQYGEVKP